MNPNKGGKMAEKENEGGEAGKPGKSGEASGVAPAMVREWLLASGEIAFIDVREEGQHGLGHPLLSVNIPYSRLEAEFRLRVPRTATRVVLVDAGDGIAAQAARRLRRLGYADLHILDGGAEAWKAAGYDLFDGTSVPSKAFAEVLELAAHTPAISAAELDCLKKAGVDHVLLDTRTPEEFSRFHVPGARNAPGVELVSRAADLIPSPDILVVVSCAGRTRSIIGAQGLINAGIPNKVVSLAGGTQGWRLAGFDLETSPAGALPERSEASNRVARERAARLRAKHGIAIIDRATVEGWLAGSEDRTTYLFDVRTHAEYEAGHVPGARWAPGGQLVQGLDLWVGVRRARLVIVDDDGVRASVAAHWLKQMGWDVGVLMAPPGTGSFEAGPSPEVTAADLPRIAGIDPAAARGWLADGGAIVSTDSSAAFRAGHPEGAHWANRARLDCLPAEVRNAAHILVVGTDTATAALVAHDLREGSSADVRLLNGGTGAWRAAGLPVIPSPTPADAERIDYLFWNHARHQGDFNGMRAYLQWELDLPPRIDADGTAGFRILL